MADLWTDDFTNATLTWINEMCKAMYMLWSTIVDLVKRRIFHVVYKLWCIKSIEKYRLNSKRY